MKRLALVPVAVVFLVACATTVPRVELPAWYLEAATAEIVVYNDTDFLMRGIELEPDGLKPVRLEIEIEPRSEAAVMAVPGRVEISTTLVIGDAEVPIQTIVQVVADKPNPWLVTSEPTSNTAQTPPAAPPEPEYPPGVSVTTAFERYGMAFVALPDPVVGLETALAVTVAEPADVVASVFRKGSNRGDRMAAERTGQQWDFSYTFSTPGNYEISIAVREPGSDGSHTRAAAIDVMSEIPPGHVLFEWDSGERPVRVVLRDIVPVDSTWVAASSVYSRYNEAKVVGDYALFSGSVELLVPDGTPVEFTHYGSGNIGGLSFALSESIVVTCRDGSFRFGAGTTFFTDGRRYRGALAESAWFSIAGRQTQVPAGNVVMIESDRVVEVSPIVPFEFSYQAAVIPVARVDIYADFEDASTLIETAGSLRLTMGDIVVNLPADALLLFDGSLLSLVYAPQEYSIEVDGERQIVGAWYNVLFDEEGAFAGIEAGGK